MTGINLNHKYDFNKKARASLWYFLFKGDYSFDNLKLKVEAGGGLLVNCCIRSGQVNDTYTVIISRG
ncbi:MAG: hypothetical protein ACLRWM_11580 [Streptococcus sp.]